MTDHTELQKLIDSLGITYNAEFVPFSQSRNKGEKRPSLNWTIAISKGRSTLQTDYMQGIAHLEGYCSSSANKLGEANNIRHAVESGKWDKNHDKAGFRTVPQVKWKAIPAPKLIDVLYSLVMESDVLDHANFEEWAGTYGYDVDSRKAEKTYGACLEIGLKLRSMLGDATLSQLREAYQEY